MISRNSDTNDPHNTEMHRDVCIIADILNQSESEFRTVSLNIKECRLLFLLFLRAFALRRAALNSFAPWISALFSASCSLLSCKTLTTRSRKRAKFLFNDNIAPDEAPPPDLPVAEVEVEFCELRIEVEFCVEFHILVYGKYYYQKYITFSVSKIPVKFPRTSSQIPSIFLNAHFGAKLTRLTAGIVPRHKPENQIHSQDTRGVAGGVVP
jgi:hypothetical protein